MPTGLTLEDYSSDMAEEDIINIGSGETVEGKRILGCVRLTGSDITFKNNEVKCYRSRDITPLDYRGPIYVSPVAENVLVEYNTIVCEMRFPGVVPCDYGVLAENATVRHNYISGSVDGIDVRSNTVIEYNVIENLSVAFEEWRDDFSHADGIQLSNNATNITIEGNVFRGVNKEESTEKRHNAMGAILLQRPSSAINKPDIIIRNNFIADYWPANRIACVTGAACLIEGNTVDNHYVGAINIGNADLSSVIKCNRFTNGQLIERENAFFAEVDNNDCFIP